MTTTASDFDVPTLIDAWEAAARDVLEVCTPLDADQWRAQTPCPGWTVGDVAAHVTDLEELLSGAPRPDHQPDYASLPHVDEDVARFTEVGVDYRRTMSKDEVLGQLAAVIAVRRAQLDAVPEGGEVFGPLGNPTTMDRLMRLRTFDTWVHEQDVRAAIAQDGGWDTLPARVSQSQMLRGLPVIWAKTVGAPEGSTLRVRVTGALPADVTVVCGPEGRGAVTDPVDDPTVTLTLTWPDLVMLMCGRAADVAATRARVTVAGDTELATATLANLTITP